MQSLFSPFLFLLFGLLLSLSACDKAGEQVERLPLPSEWEFRQAGQESWLPANVPGTVHTDLLANKKIEDPYYRDNESQLQWIENEDWEYQTSFSVSKGQMKKAHLELQFEGLDTYADVYVNDSLLLEANNMFREWRVDIKALAKQGSNSLRIVFHSPLKAAELPWRMLGYELPGGIRVMTRKAGFHYGWDWGPRFVTSGLWRPASLEAWNDARILDLQVVQDELTDEKARLRAIFEIEHSGKEMPATLKLLISGKAAAEPFSTTLKAGINQIEVPFEISQPQRWWCNGLGTPHLYEIEGALDLKTETVDNRKTRIGLRTLELVQEPDSVGQGFAFHLNGRPVFMKGANYIPQDNFQPRVSESQYRSLMEDVVDANMNMLRVWGGGIYENDLFYDLCDEMGILVWQDFMFACAMYPGDEAYLENVKQEAIDNIKRLRNHPSIALWCGNNENKEGWFRWGWQDNFTEAQRKTVWDDYQALFNDMLPEMVSTYHPGAAYWPSSPSFGRGNPIHRFTGDAHYWGVWHDAEPFEVLKETVPRFMSEFGFQSFPEMKTIATFTEPGDRKLGSEVMNVHQKHPRGNELIQIYMDRDYPKPKDFASFVYLSQVLQAEGMKIGLEAQRRAMPFCMGTLYWQLNDCWPVASWSGRDNLGRWKALHYHVRDAFAPILVSPVVEGEDRFKVYVVSDQMENLGGAKLKVEVINFNGKIEHEWEETFTVWANSSQVAFDTALRELEKGAPDLRSVVKVTLSLDGQELARNHFYFAKPKDLKLPEPGLQWKVTEAKDHFIISVKAESIARNVYLSIDAEGWFEDNYFDLMPGEERDVRFFLKDQLPNFKKDLKVVSLVDSW